MRNRHQVPRTGWSLRSFTILSALAVGCIGVVEPGCGGNGDVTPLTNPPEDAGPDAAPTPDATISEDSSPPSEDSSTASEDSSSSSEDSSTANDSSTPTDSGEDSSSPLDSGQDSAAQDSATPVDSGQDSSSPACTGSETACTTSGSLAGLCVTSQCLPCNSPADNGNCTSAYGTSGNPSWVCDTAGSCVPGNCNTDADCTGDGGVDEICGLTTPNFCGKCTTDTQCQSDPSYGPGTICDTATGGCVAATCTSAGASCPNAADFCCGAGGAIGCAGAGCSCVPGDCCTNTDCTANANGGICGAGGPNVCGKCTLDSQCTTGTVCNTTSGQCVAAACTGTPGVLGGQPGTCTPNAADMCCSAQPCILNTGADACCPGTAGNTYCASLPGGTNNSVCNPAAYVCTTCPAVSGTTYIVDPTNGSDAQGTGNPGTPAVESCAFKTITRALEVIGTASAATTIEVVGGTTGPSAASGEVFPIKIPANVTITTQASSGAVTVTAPAGKSAFTMDASPSAIQGNTGASLTITTASGGATDGIVVGGNAGTSGTTSISNVTITGMGTSGILVNGGTATIGAGVVSNDNGTATVGGHGLEVTAGAADITAPAGGAATTFNGNTAHGILVLGTGHITLTGSVTSASSGVGTVEANGNTLAGVWIENTAGSVATVGSTITGLVSFGSTGGNGLHVFAGSHVSVRSSVFLGNKGNGVLVSQGAGASNSVDGIDLGDVASNGLNVFQAPFNSGNNTGVGICLDVANGTPVQTLSAVGNQFQVTNCATTTAGTKLLLNPKACANAVQECSTGVCDLGLANPAGGATLSTNTFNVSQCTQ